MDAATRQLPDMGGAIEADRADRDQDDAGPLGAATLDGGEAGTADREPTAVTVPDGDYAIEVLGGDFNAKADQGRITIEALQSITLKVGQSSITIDQNGITIRGLLIDVEGALQTGVKGLRTEIKAAGLLQMGGGLTMIG